MEFMVIESMNEGRQGHVVLDEPDCRLTKRCCLLDPRGPDMILGTFRREKKCLATRV